MEQIKIRSKGLTYFVGGKIRGHVANKWNRMAKLVARFDELDAKFRGMAERGQFSITENFRCALACLLMMHTGIRVGNESSAEGYMTKPHPFSKKEPEFVKTYGLTTLLTTHLCVKRTCAELNFVGKKQVDNSFTIYDPQLVYWLRALQLWATEHAVMTNKKEVSLFCLSDYQLTRFIKTYVGKCFSPKDFRCMRANMYAWEIASSSLTSGYKRPSEKPMTKKEFKAGIVKPLFEFVAKQLNNTPGVCKKSYIHDGLVPYLETLFVNQKAKPCTPSKPRRGKSSRRMRGTSKKR